MGSVAVGDLDDHGAVVAVGARAARRVLEVDGAGEGQRAAAGVDREEGGVDAVGVVVRRDDRVGLGGRAVGVGRLVGADRLGVLVHVDGLLGVARVEGGRELVDVVDGDGHGLVAGVAAVVGRTDDDDVLVVAPGVAGGLVVGPRRGGEPERAAVDLEEGGVGAGAVLGRCADGVGDAVARVGVS